MLSLKRRVQLLCAGPFLAATWHCETWTMSNHIADRLANWVRLKLGQMVGIHLEGDTERDVNHWWKNIRRAGKVALHVCGMDPARAVFNHHWRSAGHLCRMQGPYIPPLVHNMNSYRWAHVR